MNEIKQALLAKVDTHQLLESHPRTRVFFKGITIFGLIVLALLIATPFLELPIYVPMIPIFICIVIVIGFLVWVVAKAPRV
ncbi:MAG: hypothetical protein LBB67_01575 [Oscillospiraceae bacterium]|jgi:uncharacterized protein YacL|nr:hypothetical protein [Oscillospiraceae bacterium]